MDKIFFFALVGGCCGSSSVCVRVFVSACFSCLVERKKKQKKKDEWHDVRMSVCVCVCVCRVKLPTELLTSPFPLFRTCHAVVKCSSSQRYDTYGASQWRLCSPLSLIIIFFFLARDSIPLFFWNLPPFSVCLCDIPSIHINILSCDTHSTSIGTEMLILPGGGRGSEKVFQNYRFPLILCVCVIWPDKSVMISITKMTIKVQCVVQKHPSTILRLRDRGGMS